MPGIEYFTIGQLHGQRGDLVAQEAEAFRDVEVVEPGQLVFVKVDNLGLEGACGEQAEEYGVEGKHDCK